MKLPNKIFNYEESVLSKLTIILKVLKKVENLSLSQLYLKVQKEFENLSEFIETVECLYLLNKIEYDYDKKEVQYVT